MYEITVSRVFAAAHAIRLYDGELEPIHGHNWTVDVTVGADELDEIEVVMDFHLLEQTINGLMAQVHNRNLNDIEPFATGGVNPSAERVAWWIGEAIRGTLPDHARLLCVKVGEAPGCVATYRPTTS